MKKFLPLLSALFLFTSASYCQSEVKVLTIGNSFAESVFVFLPQIVKSIPNCKLTIDRANIGGCSLQRHWEEHLKSEKDPSHKPYNRKYSLKDKLLSQKWDIVTIQQASILSFKEESFYPYADNLIGLIKKYAPQAEIVIQQTWSYRADHPSLITGKKNWNQNVMFEKLAANYKKLAEKYSLRVIPTGLAVQISRKESPVKFKLYDLNMVEKLNWPDLPPQAGDVVGDFSWKKRKGKMILFRDSIHLNDRGRYLQACLWFAFLYKRKCDEIRFVPKNIGDEDALMLQKFAQKAIDSYQQSGTDAKK